MIRTIIIPDNDTLQLSIPSSYIGKEIEVLLYAKEELIEKKIKPKKSMSEFSGAISEKDYQSLKEHAELARKEWNRAI
jgi:hypothetical protein